MPEISIIVPVYKVEKYLDRCVESILNQTFTDFELILVDDGSPDNCPQMCDEWEKKDERIRVIHKENGGVSVARNVGLDNAKGNFIGFVDSDDWILPDMYQTLYELIENGKYDISICGIVRTIEEKYIDTLRSSEEKYIYSKEEYLKKILKVKTQDSNHYPCNKLYRKEVMDNVKFPEGLSIGEDVESTFLAVVNSEKIIETKKVGYIYWLNLESATIAAFDAKQLDYIKICDRIVDIAKKRCTEDIVKYAQQFRYRASLGILCKMAISDISENFDKKFYEKKLVKELKEHYFVLLGNTMPLSRKVIMTCMCINYPITELFIGGVSRLFRHRIKLRF